MFKVNDYVSYEIIVGDYIDMCKLSIEYCYKRCCGRVIGVNNSGILIGHYSGDRFINKHSYSYLRIVKLGEYRKIRVKSWFWGEYEKEVYVKEN